MWKCLVVMIDCGEYKPQWNENGISFNPKSRTLYFNCIYVILKLLKNTM